MPIPFGMIAANAIGTATNTGLGLLLQKQQDKRQLEQQGKLGQQQLGLNIAQMQAQKELDLEMWEKTNFKAQRDQMEMAGLSPGLIYGQSGAGGATTGGSGGNVSAPSAPAGGGEILGLQLLNAQKGLIEAQTKKTEAEANKTAGVDTKLGETQIESLTQGIKNQKAVQRLTELQGDMAEVQTLIMNDTYDDAVAQVRYTARKTMQELRSLTINNEISEETMQEKIGIVQGELIGLGLTNELKRVQKNLTEEQVKQTVASVQQGWKKLSIDQRNAMTNLANSDIARWNAQTNFKEFLMKVQQSEQEYSVKKGTLALQQLINDVPNSERLTLEALSKLLNIAKQ